MQAPVPIDSDLYATWAAAGNSKATRYRPITATAQPSYDPATQGVVQSGWTISSTDVQAVWQVVALDANTQQQLANQALYNQLMATNVVTTLTGGINNWATLSAAQKDNLALLDAKILRALLRAPFGVNN